MNKAKYWIDKLQLKSHPEGGFYKETYRSEFYISSSDLKDSHYGKRRSSSLIYYLLEGEERSHFHRLNSDEIWIYQQGGALNIHMISPKGELITEVLGCDIENGEKMQVIVPANYWFAAELENINDYSLLSCLVSPGFVFDDFELAKKEQLAKNFPKHKQLINRLSF